MSLTALMYNHSNTIVSSRDFQNVMNIAVELYTFLSRLSKQPYLLLTEFSEIVCLFESNYQLQYSPSDTGRIHDMCTLESFNYCASFDDAIQAFLLTIGCIAVGIYCIDVGGYKIFDSYSGDVYGMAHPQETCVLLEVPTLHELKIIFKRCTQIQIVDVNSIDTEQCYIKLTV